ncbi:MAG: thioredoxin domain-containing protein [Clostridiales bacterium]|nr:thioredoxin domain-containing protein [Clostridiales bacterium]
MNALIREKSPYLLQHADNPVDWLPWGEEAFARAKREDKPVFLSIGYSTCHWCHVMAHESFESDEVAAILNAGYVCIKVDREERPDVDQVYMNACIAMSGTGGWPLTAFLTPEQQPFYVTTYLPKEARNGRLGLTELLKGVLALWDENREDLLSRGREITAHIRRMRPAEPSKAPLDEAFLSAAAEKILADYNNGVAAPLFPMPHKLLFLLWQGQSTRNRAMLEAVRAALSEMYRGGIHDHLGGGFSRYSTDAKWLVPHFEKMLYDNALLALTYAEAGAALDEPVFARAAEGILDYVLREMTDAGGGFHSAQDADSGGEEGKFYVFSPEEVLVALGKGAGDAFCARYDIAARGNFEGKSIPNLLNDPNWKDAGEAFKRERAALLSHRSKRHKLHKDDKVLTAWNGLMIAALCRAGVLLGKEDYLTAADRAVEFLSRTMITRDGTLLARWRDGEAGIDGTLDDYAFLAWGLVEHCRARLAPESLLTAKRLAEKMHALFADGDGGYFMTASQSLIARPKEVFDGAIPSGNGVAALVLAEIAAHCSEPVWQARLDDQFRFLAANMKKQPEAHAMALCALRFVLLDRRKIVAACADEASAAKAREALLSKRRDRLHIALLSPASRELWRAIDPDIEQYPPPRSGCMWYVCKDGACEPPTARFPDAHFENLPQESAVPVGK